MGLQLQNPAMISNEGTVLFVLEHAAWLTEDACLTVLGILYISHAYNDLTVLFKLALGIHTTHS